MEPNLVNCTCHYQKLPCTAIIEEKEQMDGEIYQYSETYGCSDWSATTPGGITHSDKCWRGWGVKLSNIGSIPKACIILNWNVQRI